MRTTKIRQRRGAAPGLVAAVATTALLIAGCGSSDDPSVSGGADSSVAVAGGTPGGSAGSGSPEAPATESSAGETVAGSADDSAGDSAAGTASGGSGGASAGESNAAAPSSFAFTDDRGESVSLDRTDLRIVAQEDAAQALMHLGIKPVGIFGGTDMETNPMLAGLDLSGVESLGVTWGEINMEKLIGVEPDIIVSTFYTGDGVLFEGGVYGFGTAEQQAQAQEIAPILAIDSTQPASQVISRFSELAAALGADVTSGQAAADKAAFDAAVSELKSAAAENSDLAVLATTPAEDQMYYAVPKAFPDLIDLQQWGVNMMEPTGELISSYYEAVSWENAAKYQPDIVLIDVRGYTLGTDALEKYPTWTAMKAVGADQIGEWVRVSLNYPDYTQRITALAELLSSADRVG